MRQINSVEGNVSSRDTFDSKEILCTLGPRLLKETGDPSIYIVQKGEVVGGTKGFLGPSENPSDQGGFTNTDKTLIAVNLQPVTKSSFFV
jgi:hypothetical protein